MKIEIVEFYPAEKKERSYVGSLHVFLTELGIDIRGIKVFNNKKMFLFFMPTGKGYDEDKNPVYFPFIDFIDEAKKKALIDEIRKAATPIIKEKLNLQEMPETKKPGFKKPLFKKPLFKKNPIQKNSFRIKKD